MSDRLATTLIAVFEAAIVAFFIGLAVPWHWQAAAVVFALGVPLYYWRNR